MNGIINDSMYTHPTQPISLYSIETFHYLIVTINLAVNAKILAAPVPRTYIGSETLEFTLIYSQNIFLSISARRAGDSPLLCL